VRSATDRPVRSAQCSARSPEQPQFNLNSTSQPLTQPLPLATGHTTDTAGTQHTSHITQQHTATHTKTSQPQSHIHTSTATARTRVARVRFFRFSRFAAARGPWAGGTERPAAGARSSGGCGVMN
jgi:hypothetical protein